MLRPLFCLLSIVLLGACAQRPEPPVSPEGRIEQLLAGAYRPARLPTAGWHAEWQVQGEQLQVDWLAPQHNTGLPIILYLPGLGQDSDAAQPLRRSWAEAGYGVLSVQPSRHGRAIFSSTDAQAGIFRGIAQRAYSAGDLQHRLSQLDQLLQEVRRRASTGDGDFSRVDWQRQVVAGFELGTQSATALLTRQQGWQPRAALLLSPYVAEPAVLRQVAVPLLSATGPADEDPFNWVMSAQNHQLFWQQLQAGETYQLLLNSMTHAQLGGSFAGFAGGAGKGGKPAGGGQRPGGKGPGGAGPGGAKGQMGPARYAGSREEMVNPREAAALLATSLAFLDCYVQNNAQARHWLQEEASQWLAPAAKLQIRKTATSTP